MDMAPGMTFVQIYHYMPNTLTLAAVVIHSPTFLKEASPQDTYHSHKTNSHSVRAILEGPIDRSSDVAGPLVYHDVPSDSV